MHSPPSSTLLREPLLRSSTPQRLAVKTSSSRRLNLVRTEPPLKHVEEEPTPPQPSIFSLPPELFVVLLVDFLNSYRSFGFRSVQYQYLVDEFGFGDVEAATLLGWQAWLLVIFGMIGAMLVDSLGVRTTAIAALTVASLRFVSLVLTFHAPSPHSQPQPSTSLMPQILPSPSPSQPQSHS